MYPGGRSILADTDEPLRTHGNPDLGAEHAHDVPANGVPVPDALLVHAGGTEPADLQLLLHDDHLDGELQVSVLLQIVSILSIQPDQYQPR